MHIVKMEHWSKNSESVFKHNQMKVQSFVSSKDHHHMANQKGPKERLVEEFNEYVQIYSMDVQSFLLLEKNLTGGSSKNSRECVQTYSMNVQSCRLFQRPLSYGKLAH